MWSSFAYGLCAPERQEARCTCSRVRRSGEVEIEIDVGDARLPAVVFTEEELRRANHHARNRVLAAPFRRSSGTVFHLTQ